MTRMEYAFDRARRNTPRVLQRGSRRPIVTVKWSPDVLNASRVEEQRRRCRRQRLYSEQKTRVNDAT
jgi:hypothetical protein